MIGHVSQKLFAITIILAIITIALSSYFMKYEYKLYSWLSSDLALFERINSMAFMGLASSVDVNKLQGGV